MKKVLLLLLAVLAGQFVFAQLNTELLGQLSYSDDLSNVWGWTSDDGHEYAIVGTFDGTSIVDITDPTDPTEIQFIDGANSIWRQIGVWSHYAYVANESGGGILCIDLENLPITGVADFAFSDGGIGITTSHILYCDEAGTIYVFGSNKHSGSTVMLDATADPMDPPYLGATDDWYVHHGFARNDTLYESNIYEGWFSVWDVSDKSSPVLLATQETPGVFTHNVVAMDNGIHLFSTDEVTNGSLGAYDISDLSDIQYKGEFRPTPGTNSIPHYTWNKEHWLTTAWYRDGLVITDNSHPEAIVMTGWYDTSPLSGNGFNGAWGVYPYFPSGNVVVSDIEEGLFVLGVDYVSAAFLSGTVTDASTSAPLFGVSVELSDPSGSTSTALDGGYITGLATAGTYSATYSKPGYITATVTGIVLENGVTTIEDVELEPLASFPFNGQVLDVVTGIGVPGASVLVQNADVSFEATTDGTGLFVIPAIFEGTYSVYAGKWGYVTNAEIDLDINIGSEVVIELGKGYYDDYLFDFNWTETATASSGDWEWGDPVGTEYGIGYCNPEDDIAGDYGSFCYITGNGGGSAGSDDVDDGYVTLTSPSFDLSTFGDPWLTFDFWFFNNGGSGTPNDTLSMILDNGLTTFEIVLDNGFTALGLWQNVSFQFSDYITPTANMHVSFKTGDNAASGHLVEAAIDRFFVFDSLTTAPVAAFDADLEDGCTPLHVHFYDLSAGATSWSWSFPGGSPATSTLASPIITYNTPGIYDVTLIATNPLGSNTLTLTSYIEVFASPVLATSAGAGSASVIISGGTAPFDILWSDGQTTETATGLEVGTYTVTVTDANGCSVNATAEVTQPSGIDWLEDGLSVTVFPNPATEYVHVVSDASGSIFWSMTDLQGRTVLESNIDPGETIIAVDGLSSGLYHVQLIDAGRLVGILSVVVE